MDSFGFKLIATPGLIGAATLAGRRWGPAVSGWLVGFPLTSAPIAIFLALDHGAAFAAASALGTLAGTLSAAAFVLTYAWVSQRLAWPATLAAAVFAFGAATFLLGFEALTIWPLTIAVFAGLSAALRLMPRSDSLIAPVGLEPPGWDIPVRMLVATAFVVVLTGLAARLGPHVTGLLSPFPLYSAILAGSAHAWQGSAAAERVSRGVLLGLFAFVTFFAVFALVLTHAGLAFAVVAAAAAALALQAASLSLVRARRPALGC